MMQPSDATPALIPTTAPPPPSYLKSKSILVTNIGASATERSITDFFSYCGKIERLSFHRAAGIDGKNEAIVTFQTDAAVTTALMLSGAQIDGSGIIVSPYTSADSGIPLGGNAPVVQSGDQISNRKFPEADEQRTKTSVVANIIAGGYALGSDIADRARDYDEEHKISTQLLLGAEELKKKVNEFDTAYGISTSVAAMGAAAAEKAKQLDQQYLISETATAKAKALDENYGLSQKWANMTSYWNSSTQYASDLATRTMQNPTVVSAAATINSYTAPIGQSIAAVEQESKALIEEQKRQRGSHDPSTQVDGPGAVPPSSAAAPAPAAGGASPTPTPAVAPVQTVPPKQA
jgi:hypothetical protein